MLDFTQLLPHSKRDVKLDTKSDRNVINEVADMKVLLIYFLHRFFRDIFCHIPLIGRLLLCYI